MLNMNRLFFVFCMIVIIGIFLIIVFTVAGKRKKSKTQNEERHSALSKAGDNALNPAVTAAITAAVHLFRGGENFQSTAVVAAITAAVNEYHTNNFKEGRNA